MHIKFGQKPVFTCVSGSNAHRQRPAPINVLHYGSCLAPQHSPLSYIYLHPHHKRL